MVNFSKIQRNEIRNEMLTLTFLLAIVVAAFALLFGLRALLANELMMSLHSVNYVGSALSVVAVVWLFLVFAVYSLRELILNFRHQVTNAILLLTSFALTVSCTVWIREVTKLGIQFSDGRIHQGVESGVSDLLRQLTLMENPASRIAVYILAAVQVVSLIVMFTAVQLGKRMSKQGTVT